MRAGRSGRHGYGARPCWCARARVDGEEGAGEEDEEDAGGGAARGGSGLTAEQTVEQILLDRILRAGPEGVTTMDLYKDLGALSSKAHSKG
jgi:hypothetical protein